MTSPQAETPTTMDITEELNKIEELITDLVARRDQLLKQLIALPPAPSPTRLGAESARTWCTRKERKKEKKMTKKQKQQTENITECLPVSHPENAKSNAPIPLSSRYAPLDTMRNPLQSTSQAQPERRKPRRKRTFSATLDPTQSQSSTQNSSPQQHKRNRVEPPEINRSSTTPPPPTTRGGNPSDDDTVDDVTSTPSPTTRRVNPSDDTMITNPTATEWITLSEVHNITASEVDQPPPPTLTTVQSELLAKCSVHRGGPINTPPHTLIIGDSIVRSVVIPGVFTYCLPGGKTLHMFHLAEALCALHPSALTLVFHVGSNDVLDRSSTALRIHLEALSLVVTSTGRTCVFSGPLPAPSKNPEHFSRAYSLHTWMKSFCSVAGHGFISHFDCFWTRSDLYRDGLHPNRVGLKQLTANFAEHLTPNPH